MILSNGNATLHTRSEKSRDSSTVVTICSAAVHARAPPFLDGNNQRPRCGLLETAHEPASLPGVLLFDPDEHELELMIAQCLCCLEQNRYQYYALVVAQPQVVEIPDEIETA